MVKLKVEKKVIEEVEVELPFYFVHDVDTFCIIYGRVDKTGCTQVTENKNGFEVERDKSNPDRWTCYLKPEYSSNKDQFEEALNEAREFMGLLSLRDWPK